MSGIDRQLSAGRRAVVACLAAVFLLFNGLSLYDEVWGRSMGLPRSGFALAVDAPAAVVATVFEKMPDGESPAHLAGVQPGDVLLAIETGDGHVFRLRGLFDVNEAMGAVHWGEPWSLLVTRDEPGHPPHEVRLLAPPLRRPALNPSDILLLAGIYVLLPLMALITAVLLGLSRPSDDNAFLASLLFFCFPTLFMAPGGSMPTVVRSVVLLARCFGPIFSGYLVLRFFLRFPSPSPLDRRFPWLSSLFFWLTLTFAFLRVVTSFSRNLSFELFYRFRGLLGPTFAGLIDGALMPLLLIMISLGLVALVQNTRRPASRTERRRMVLLAAGALIGLVPLGVLVVLFTTMGTQPLWLSLIVTATVWTFPASFVYAVVRHQVFDIRLVVRRGLQYALVTRGAAIALGLICFAVLYFELGPMVERMLPQEGHGLASLGSAVVALGIAAGLREVNRRVMPSIDRAFFRDAYDARRILSELADAVRLRAAEPERLLDLVAEELHKALHPRGVSIVLRASEAGRLFAPPRDGAPDDQGCDVPGAFCCAMVSPSPAAESSGLDVRALCGVTIPPSSPLSALLTRAAEIGHTVDVLPAVADDRRTVPPNSVRLAQLGDERRLFEPLAARLIVPLATSQRLLGFLVLGEKLSEEPYTREDRQLLLSVAGQVAIALDYAELIGQAAERERVRGELELAQEVQAQLFPQVQPRLSTLEYTGMSLPARILGGDYFDFLPVAPHRVGLALADISGKGISAALLMATVQGALRSHAAEWGDHLGELVADVNQQLYASSAPNRFATFFYGLYDDEARTLTYVNAGHNPPILVRRGGSLPTSRHQAALAAAASEADRTTAAGVIATARPRIENVSVERLTEGGTVIGMFPDFTYDTTVVQLQPGDTLVIYSDGVTDVTNALDEDFGDGRLVSLVARHVDLGPDALRDRIVAALRQHAAGIPFADDVSLIVAKVS